MPAVNWMTGPAADRRCPEYTTLTVREAFALEAKHLLTLPENPYSTYEQVVVKINKTADARFDLNDYSVTYHQVQRTLTEVSGLLEVRSSMDRRSLQPILGVLIKGCRLRFRLISRPCSNTTPGQ